MPFDQVTQRSRTRTHTHTRARTRTHTHPTTHTRAYAHAYTHTTPTLPYPHKHIRKQARRQEVAFQGEDIVVFLVVGIPEAHRYQAMHVCVRVRVSVGLVTKHFFAC
jgi:hypothetical protein